MNKNLKNLPLEKMQNENNVKTQNIPPRPQQFRPTNIARPAGNVPTGNTPSMRPFRPMPRPETRPIGLGVSGEITSLNASKIVERAPFGTNVRPSNPVSYIRPESIPGRPISFPRPELQQRNSTTTTSFRPEMGPPRPMTMTSGFRPDATPPRPFNAQNFRPSRQSSTVEQPAQLRGSLPNLTGAAEARRKSDASIEPAITGQFANMSVQSKSRAKRVYANSGEQNSFSSQTSVGSQPLANTFSPAPGGQHQVPSPYSSNSGLSSYPGAGNTPIMGQFGRNPGMSPYPQTSGLGSQSSIDQQYGGNPALPPVTPINQYGIQSRPQMQVGQQAYTPPGQTPRTSEYILLTTDTKIQHPISLESILTKSQVLLENENAIRNPFSMPISTPVRAQCHRTLPLNSVLSTKEIAIRDSCDLPFTAFQLQVPFCSLQVYHWQLSCSL